MKLNSPFPLGGKVKPKNLEIWILASLFPFFFPFEETSDLKGTGPFAAKALPDSASPSAGGVNGVSAGRVASGVSWSVESVP